jgi:hypothetical protein
MLYDRSSGQTTQVSGENAMPFEYGRLRRVVVLEGLNTIITMGREQRDLVQFELVWHRDPTQTVEKIKNYEARLWRQEGTPHLARTVDETPTILLSQWKTRPYTLGQLKMRYVKVGAPLGSGQFGAVHKAIDVDSGNFMAVKIIERLASASKQEHEEWKNSLYYALRREVETLSSISHVSRASSTSDWA